MKTSTDRSNKNKEAPAEQTSKWARNSSRNRGSNNTLESPTTKKKPLVVTWLDLEPTKLANKHAWLHENYTETPQDAGTINT